MKELEQLAEASKLYAREIVGIADEAAVTQYAKNRIAAFLWHVATLAMTQEDQDRVSEVACRLLAGGYAEGVDLESLQTPSADELLKHPLEKLADRIVDRLTVDLPAEEVGTTDSDLRATAHRLVLEELRA